MIVKVSCSMVFRIPNRRSRTSPARPGLEHELDLPAVADRSRPSFIDPAELRLVVNPFLSLLIFVLWGLVFRWTYLEKNAVHMLVAVLVLLVLAGPNLYFFLQYHCFDCGRTESFFRWKAHACAPLMARRMMNRRSWFRLPHPESQLVFWGYFILVAAFFYWILRLPT